MHTTTQTSAGSDLDDDGMSGKVNTPGQRGCAHQNLQVPSGEHALHQRAVLP